MLRIAPRAVGAPGLLAFALMAAAALAACRSPSAAPSPEPSPASASTAASTPGARPSPLASLRDFDFESPAFVAGLIDRAGGGEVHAERVHFEDLTDDGVEEALVVVESGGTAGDVAVAVYRLEEGAPRLAFFRALAGRVEVRLGLVVVQEGVYAPGDAQCCPSRLREIAFGWDGEGFALLSDQVVDNPRN